MKAVSRMQVKETYCYYYDPLHDQVGLQASKVSVVNINQFKPMKRKKCERQIDEHRLNCNQNTQIRAITRYWSPQNFINNPIDYYITAPDAENAT